MVLSPGAHHGCIHTVTTHGFGVSSHPRGMSNIVFRPADSQCDTLVLCQLVKAFCDGAMEAFVRSNCTRFVHPSSLQFFKFLVILSYFFFRHEHKVAHFIRSKAQKVNSHCSEEAHLRFFVIWPETLAIAEFALRICLCRQALASCDVVSRFP